MQEKQTEHDAIQSKIQEEMALEESVMGRVKAVLTKIVEEQNSENREIFLDLDRQIKTLNSLLMEGARLPSSSVVYH